jgi:hypothetical protein
VPRLPIASGHITPPNHPLDTITHRVCLDRHGPIEVCLNGASVPIAVCLKQKGSPQAFVPKIVPVVGHLGATQRECHTVKTNSSGVKGQL